MKCALFVATTLLVAIVYKKNVRAQKKRNVRQTFSEIARADACAVMRLEDSYIRQNSFIYAIGLVTRFFKTLWKVFWCT